MVDLVHIFNFSSREEIAALCKEVAALITPILKKRKPNDPPVIIGITGNVNAGKSIFWDEIRQHLFESGGIFIANKSESSEIYGRHYETWVGNVEELSKEQTIFLCNVNALYANTVSCSHINNDRFDALTPLYGRHGKSPSELGDIIILTNQHDGLIPNEQFTLTIDMAFTKTPPVKNWDRYVEITIPDTSPLYSSKKARELLNFPAP